MSRSSRKKIILALILALALGIFLPPNINGTRFSKQLAATLSTAVGRQVKIGQVKFRLLPRPGFDLYDFEVVDDPRFNAEPLLLCGEVTADLRLTSLWQGRLEIANLKLKNATDRTPPSLNLVYYDGHWNLESLLVRAEQVATAPTARKRAEQRPRFPYIEADAGRINLKFGPEKKPYALTNTDFALWLAAEDHWHVRLEGQPVRTDMNLRDIGTIKIEGDLKRSSDLRQTPVKLQLEWRNGQLGQLSSLVLGHDKGWRGGLDLSIQLFGSLADMHIAADAGIEDLRRYDIDRRGMLPLHPHCLGEYMQGMLDFNCDVPISTGTVRVNARRDANAPQDYTLSVAARRVPLSAITTFLLHAKRTIPDDLTASGELDADFAFENHAWRGRGTTSPFVLRSAVAAQPIEVSAISFHAGEVEQAIPLSRKKKRNLTPVPPSQPASLTVDPFTIQLDGVGSGAPVHAQASFTTTGYLIEARGAATLEQLLGLGRVSGFRSRITNISGSTDFDLNVNGVWANFAPAQPGGTAHLRNIVATVPGIKQRLLLTSDAHLTDAAIILSDITARFEHLPLEVKGSVSAPVNCQSGALCSMQFDLHADAFSTTELASLLGLDQRNWRLPFLSGSADKLPDFRASGTLQIETLELGRLGMENVTAHLELADRTLLISRLNSRAAGGSIQGDWRVDWSTLPVRYSGAGTLTALALDRLGLPRLATWVNGKTNMKYAVNFSGLSSADMLQSATGKAEFLVINGASQAVALESSKPLHFQSLQGACELNRQILSFTQSKVKAENRIYDISGSVSLADKQAKLKIGNSANQWEITGALDNPNVVAQRLTAQQAATHAQ